MNRLDVFLLRLTLSVCALMLPCSIATAQELQAKVVVNHAQIQDTDAAVFEELQSRITQFLNERRWTSLHFESKERIPCSFNITVSSYEKGSNLFTCKAVIQANRPVYNAAYATPIYHNTDNDFNFEYAPFDQLNFNRSEEHTSELQSRQYLVCRLLLEKKKKQIKSQTLIYTNNTNIHRFNTLQLKRYYTAHINKPRYSLTN